MKHSVFFILVVIVLAAAIGIFYYFWANNSEQQKQVSEVKTGQVEIDYRIIEDLQQQVDQGHQPWRLDPLLVAQSEAEKYGFLEEDIQALQLPPYSRTELGNTLTTIQGEIPHGNTVYVVTITQPIPGQGNIWIITEIQPN